MKKHIPNFALSLLLAGASSLGFAGDWDNFYVKGGLANPQADSRDMTHKSKGFTFEGGYVLTPTSWTGEVRFYYAYVKMGGDENFQPWVSGYDASGNTIMKYPYSQYAADANAANYTINEDRFAYDMTGHAIGIDFSFPFKVYGQDFSVFTGPSLHTWYMVRLNPLETEGDRSLKAGWRLGLQYHFDKHLDFSAAYTQTEWRSDAHLPFEQGGNPSRPAYLSLTAGYRF